MELKLKRSAEKGRRCVEMRVFMSLSQDCMLLRTAKVMPRLTLAEVARNQCGRGNCILLECGPESADSVCSRLLEVTCQGAIGLV